METWRPVHCVWELTLACDLRCGHCGSRAGKARTGELDTDACLAVVASLARLGVEVVTLSGGEPTLRPDWAIVAGALRDHGMIPNLVTNGFAMTAALARAMKDAGLANVAVSLDGPEAVHERIRGRDTFARATRALALLADAGVPSTVMTTANRLNLELLEETCQIAEALGARSWRVQLGKAMGNLRDRRAWMLAPADLLDLLPRLDRLATRSRIRVRIGDSIGFCGPHDSRLRAVSWDGKAQRWGGCQAGLRAIGLESDGGVRGCLSLQARAGEGHDPFLEGNLHERPLEAIWSDPDAFAYNRRFRSSDLTGFCQGCQHARACRGGARCVAATTGGSLFEDPFCYHRVAEMARTRPLRRVARHLAAAGLGASLVLGGCGGDDPAPAADAAAGDAAVPPAADAAAPPDAPAPDAAVPPADAAAGDAAAPDALVDCAQVCCECEYGVMPEDIWRQCCAP